MPQCQAASKYKEMYFSGWCTYFNNHTMFCNFLFVFRVRHVTGRQLNILCEYLNLNKDIAVAYNRSLRAKEHARRKWEEITILLNNEEGASKDWKGWCKVGIQCIIKLV